MRNNLYIPSIDAKDLYLAKDFQYGFSLSQKNGNENLRKYKNSFDYSLDLIELRNVAKKVYKNPEKLSFINKGKEYSSKVINVTYKYCVREYNELVSGVFVKVGHKYDAAEVKDGLLIIDDELLVVDTNVETPSPIDNLEILGKYFKMTNNGFLYKYERTNKNIKLIKSAKQLREWTYTEGFTCNNIHYCRFKRSSGSARVGKCLFIDARLYPAMHKSEQCGLNVKLGDPLDIAAFEAYIALPNSSIIDTINIAPENILVIDDYESEFYEDAVCTDLKDDNWLTTSEKNMKD